MGNENSSMCACYDAQQEKQRGEQNIYAQRAYFKRAMLNEENINNDISKNYDQNYNGNLMKQSNLPSQAFYPSQGLNNTSYPEYGTTATSNLYSYNQNQFQNYSGNKQSTLAPTNVNSINDNQAYQWDGQNMPPKISNQYYNHSQFNSRESLINQNPLQSFPPQNQQIKVARLQINNIDFYPDDQGLQKMSNKNAYQQPFNHQDIIYRQKSKNSSRSRSRKNRRLSQAESTSAGRMKADRILKKRNNETEESYDNLQYNKPRMLSPQNGNNQQQRNNSLNKNIVNLQNFNDKFINQQNSYSINQNDQQMNANYDDFSSQQISNLQSSRFQKVSNSFNAIDSPKPRIGSVTKGQKQKLLSISDYKKFKRIQNIELRYLFGKVLGQGAFGTVRLCMHRDSQKTFAIKIMEKKAIQQQQIYVQLLQNELSILGEKSHPNIIRIIDLLEDNLNYYIVSEVVKGGELFKRLTKVQSFTESQAADVVYQIMLGLNYMHLQNVTHRDMKPENILLVSNKLDDFRIKIADLGFAQEFDREKGLDLVLGTPLYMAPELVLHQKYSEKVDVWSLGVIVYQLLSGQTPFDGHDIKQINQNICQKLVNFKDKCWRCVSSNAKDFILNCLIKNQNQRPSIAELFSHPWITQMPENETLDEEVQLRIQKNFIQYQNCSDFQKIVLSLISGLSTTEQELEKLQKEFLRLDKDKTGILNKQVLEQMTSKRLSILYNLNWDEIIDQCDQNGNQGIDYQEFISACIDRKVLLNQEDVMKAFRMLDYNNDGVISLDDFENLFNSYGGARMNNQIWSNLLMEADQNGDGTVSFQEFQSAMGNLLRKSLHKKRRNTTN